MKILVVDDSSTMRRIIINTLKTINFTNIVEAENGKDALGKMDGVEFLITDWNMPVMSGLELVQAVRAENQSVPILMVTTNASRDDVVAALRAGVDNYVVKPMTPDVLKEKIEAILAKR